MMWMIEPCRAAFRRFDSGTVHDRIFNGLVLYGRVPQHAVKGCTFFHFFPSGKMHAVSFFAVNIKML